MEDFRAGGFLDKRFGRTLNAASATRPKSPQTPAPERNAFTTSPCFIQRRFGIESTLDTTPMAPTRPAPALRSPQARPQGPHTRMVGGLLFPRSPPTTRRNTPLATASRHYARVRAQALTEGAGDMAIRGDLVSLMDVGEASIQEAVDYGVNASTAQKDERAWVFWEEVCMAQGTSPLRTAADVRDYPDRQSQLLAVLLLHTFAVCQPRDPRRHFVKPRSALAYPLAIIHIFGRWGIALPGYKAVVAAMHGLMRLYIAYHGPHSMAPRRAEPVKFEMMRAIYHIPPSSRVGRWVWTDEDHDVFMFKRLNVFMMYTAFRLAEIVAHLSHEVMFITRACLVWCICGAIIPDPNPS